MKNALFGSALKTVLTILVVLVVGVAGVAVAYGTGVLGSTTAESLGVSSSPSASATTTATASASPSAPPTTFADTVVVPRPVTTGTGIPSANVLHDATFAAVTSGWVLTVFDAGTYDASHGPVPGIRLVYLVSPLGQRFEVAHFPAAQDVDVAAWNVAAGKALLVQHGFDYAVLNIATGAVGSTWRLCGTHPVTAVVQPQADGNWAFRGSCIGAQIDGVYSDAGADVSPSAYFKSQFGTWSADLGAGEVAVVTFGSPQLFLVTAPGWSDPAETYKPAGMDSCNPLGPGRAGTFAVGCAHGAHASAWELHVNGDAATPLVTEAQVDAFTSAVTGPGTPSFLGNCLVGGHEVLEVATTGRAAAFASSGGLTQVGLGETAGAEYCWGASGATGLFSGEGSLWTYVQGGATVPMAVVTGAKAPGEIIGVALTRSVIAP
jgi:hypothetical protein